MKHEFQCSNELQLFADRIIQVIKSSFIAIPSLLSWSCDTATRLSVIILVTPYNVSSILPNDVLVNVLMHALKILMHALTPLEKLTPQQH